MSWDALKIGLIEEVVPNEIFLERAIELARAIAKGCPTSTALSKKAMNEGIALTLNEALEKEKFYFIENILTLEWN
ncbi:MAG: enoyl-CoA hydratase/isomerase family protein [Candidatus Lokiarchaeota archaeon]|nr:enoyl-CoA hydratase/isomerase family protein [Candidatus Lokiarchaeota archaeon]